MTLSYVADCQIQTNDKGKQVIPFPPILAGRLLRDHRFLLEYHLKHGGIPVPCSHWNLNMVAKMQKKVAKDDQAHIRPTEASQACDRLLAALWATAGPEGKAKVATEGTVEPGSIEDNERDRYSVADSSVGLLTGRRAS